MITRSKNKKNEQKSVMMNGSNGPEVGNLNGTDMIYGNFSGENIKSLDEIDFDDEDDDIGSKNQLQNSNNHNCNDDDTKEQMWRDNRCNDSNKNKKGDND